MKKSLLLGLGSLLLGSTMASAQEPVPAPLPFTQPAPALAPTAAPLFSSTAGEVGANGADSQRFWVSSEYLLWWTKGVPVNTPLLTRALDPADPTSGALGTPNTGILLGRQSYDLSAHSGGRFTLGGWLDADHIVGLEGNYLFIAPQTINRSFSSNASANSPILAFPYRDATSGLQTSEQFTIPGNLGGGANLQLSNRLQGAELNLPVRFFQTDTLKLMGLAGFRWVNFEENLDFDQGNYGLAGSLSSGQVFTAQDTFHANNNFYGGQLGLRGEYRLGNFSVEGTGKVALGSMYQVMDINGITNARFSDGFTLVNTTGGSFAQGTNIGRHTTNVFCVVPEANLKLNYNFRRWLQFSVGYNFLYLSDVERPGTAIDHNINATQAPFAGGAAGSLTGVSVPAFSFSRSDFWAQGISFGLEFKF
jgi:hypothetical protein